MQHRDPVSSLKALGSAPGNVETSLHLVQISQGIPSSLGLYRRPFHACHDNSWLISTPVHLYVWNRMPPHPSPVLGTVPKESASIARLNYKRLLKVSWFPSSQTLSSITGAPKHFYSPSLPCVFVVTLQFLGWICSKQSNSAYSASKFSSALLKHSTSRTMNGENVMMRAWHSLWFWTHRKKPGLLKRLIRGKRFIERERGKKSKDVKKDIERAEKNREGPKILIDVRAEFWAFFSLRTVSWGNVEHTDNVRRAYTQSVPLFKKTIHSSITIYSISSLP